MDVNLEPPWQVLVEETQNTGGRALVRQLMTHCADDPDLTLYIYCRLVTAYPSLRRRLRFDATTSGSPFSLKTQAFLTAPELLANAKAHDRFEIDTAEYIKRSKITWYIS